MSIAMLFSAKEMLSSCSLTTTRDDLVVEHLGAGYRHDGRKNTVVAKDLTFVVPAGSVVGLVGPNGCGKSTILRAIVDSTFRTAGRVRLGSNERIPTGSLGYLPQQSVLTLFPWQNTSDNILLWDDIHGISAEQRNSHLAAVCEEYRLRPPLDRGVAHLSGGERVKVALLRSLAITDLRGWILDEPFEGLDADSRELLISLIRQVAQKGLPVLLTTHREEDLIALGAQILRLVGKPIDRVEPATNFSHEATPVVNRMEPFRSEHYTMDSEEQKPIGSSAVCTLAGLAIGILVWMLVSIFVGRPTLVPEPWAILREMLSLLQSETLLPHFFATLARAAGAWFIGTLIGLPFGIIIGYYPALYRLLAPWLSLGRSFPIFVLTGVAIGMFPGQSEMQRLFLIVLTIGLVFLQIVSAAAYVAPRRRRDIARIYGATELFSLRKVMLFESVGGILAAMEATLPLALIVTLVVETFLIPSTGIGIYVFNALNNGDVRVVLPFVLWPAILCAICVNTIRALSSRWRYEL